jgi:hypothetical protein
MASTPSLNASSLVFGIVHCPLSAASERSAAAGLSARIL